MIKLKQILKNTVQINLPSCYKKVDPDTYPKPWIPKEYPRPFRDLP